MQNGTLAQRMRAARERLRPTPSQGEMGRLVAIKVNRPRAYTAANVGHWEIGKHKPSPDVVRAWSELTGAPIGWLMTGLEIIDSKAGVITPAQAGGRVVPKIFISQAIQEPIDYRSASALQTHFPCSPGSFSIDVFDSRNEPEFREGRDRLVIDPDEAPQPGDMVLAVVDDAPVFGKYERRKGGVVEITASNAVWDSVEIHPERGDRIVGVMTEHAKPRRSS